MRASERERWEGELGDNKWREKRESVCVCVCEREREKQKLSNLECESLVRSRHEWDRSKTFPNTTHSHTHTLTHSHTHTLRQTEISISRRLLFYERES